MLVKEAPVENADCWYCTERHDMSHVRTTLRWRHNDHDGVSITSLTIVYSTAYSDADQRKHQSSASLAFVWGIHRGPVNSPHKWPVTRKIFPFDDVIMNSKNDALFMNKFPIKLYFSAFIYISRWAIGGRWLQSPASQYGDGGKPDFR